MIILKDFLESIKKEGLSERRLRLNKNRGYTPLVK